MNVDDYIRGFAADIGLNPPVGGNFNVQDYCENPGGTGAGPVVLAGNVDQAEADAATTLTADGATHNISCIMATPPAWLDTSGNIIAAGQYQTGLQISQDVSPTTPGDYLSVGFDSESALVPADALAVDNTASLGGVFNVGTADLPFAEVVRVVMPTDATLSVDVTPFITRLAYNAT